MFAIARNENLLIQEVGDELVVYDKVRDRAHCLNRTAALVWSYCDGQTTMKGMTKLLQKELNLPAADEGIVSLALNQLDEAHLMGVNTDKHGREPSISRRELIKRVGLIGSMAVLLPVVTSLAVPVAAESFSPAEADECGCQSEFKQCMTRTKGQSGKIKKQSEKVCKDRKGTCESFCN